jgi:hypothetical protein
MVKGRGVMSQLISPEDIIKITGAKKPRDQCAVLEKHNIYFVESKLDGRPQTSWYHFNNPTHLRNINNSNDEPDFNAMQKG